MTLPTIDNSHLVVGAELPTLVKNPITTRQLVQYAGASGDFNPIHYDEPWAKQAGFKSVIAHGMLSMGFLGQLVSDWVGPGAIKSLAVRFRQIAYPGDTITCRGRISAVGESAGGKLVTIELTASNQAGAVTVEGSATVFVHS